MPLSPPPPAPSRQLPLPLDPPRSPLPLPLPASTISAGQVWRTLAPGLQATVRHALLQVAQEVLRETLPAREDHHPAP
jgi:hypothetical protein